MNDKIQLPVAIAFNFQKLDLHWIILMSLFHSIDKAKMAFDCKFDRDIKFADNCYFIAFLPVNLLAKLPQSLAGKFHLSKISGLLGTS